MIPNWSAKQCNWLPHARPAPFPFPLFLFPCTYSFFKVFCSLLLCLLLLCLLLPIILFSYLSIYLDLYISYLSYFSQFIFIYICISYLSIFLDFYIYLCISSNAYLSIYISIYLRLSKKLLSNQIWSSFMFRLQIKMICLNMYFTDSV